MPGPDDTLERHFRRSPLLLPLAAVAAVVCAVHVHADFWLAAAFALGVALILRLWRQAALCFVLGAAVLMHCTLLQRDAETLLKAVDPAGVLHGRVAAVSTEYITVEQGICGGRVWVFCHGNLACEPGDTVSLSVTRAELPPPPVRGMADPQAQMRREGVCAACDLVEGCVCGQDVFSWAYLRRRALLLRSRALGALACGEPGAAQDMLCALLAGDGRAEPSRPGSALHLAAAAGLPVACLWCLSALLLHLLHLPVVWRRCLVPFPAACLVLLGGLGCSALTAFLVLMVMHLQGLFSRRICPDIALCAAALAVLLAAPYRLFHPDFLLAFAVYAGVYMAVWVCGVPAGLSWRSRCLYGLRLVSVGALAVWLFTLPVCLACFHSLHAYAAATWVLLLPLLPAILLLGLAAVLLGWVPYLGAALHWCALQPCALYTAGAGALDSLPAAYKPACESPAPESSLILNGRYGSTVCVLGNPGLVINCGTAEQAQRTICPALFHAGYRPAALLPTGHTKARSGGTDAMLQYWPHLNVIRTGDIPPQGCSFATEAGVYTVFPASRDIRHRLDANKSPVILWQHDGRRVLYAGDASAATFMAVPEEERRADALVIGGNPVQPLLDPQLIRSTGATQIILLPSAQDLPLEPQNVAPAQIIRLAPGSVYEPDISGISPSM